MRSTIKHLLSAVILLAFFFLAAATSSDKKEGTDAEATNNTTTTQAEPEADAPAPEPEKVENWYYQTDEDKMTGKSVYYAQVTSTNTVEFDFPYGGGSKFKLLVRNKEGQNELLLSVTKGQFMGSYGGQKVRIRFDEEEPFLVSFNEPSDASSDLIFLKSIPKIIEGLKKAKKMLIQAEFYQEGNVIMEFDVEGLKWEH